MLGVSAMGLCDEKEDLHGDIPGIKPMYTHLEKMMLDAIISECRSCIGSEGEDCMNTGGQTNCPFVEVRQACGITEFGGPEP